MKKTHTRQKNSKQSAKSLSTQSDGAKSTNKVTKNSLSKEDMKSLIDSEIKFPKHLKLEEDISSRVNDEALTALIDTLIEKIDSLYDDFEILVIHSALSIICVDSRKYARRMKKKILELPRGGVLFSELKLVRTRLLRFSDAIVT